MKKAERIDQRLLDTKIAFAERTNRDLGSMLAAAVSAHSIADHNECAVLTLEADHPVLIGVPRSDEADFRLLKTQSDHPCSAFHRFWLNCTA